MPLDEKNFATGISFMEDHPQVPALRHAWVQGYRSVRPLSDEEEAEIDTGCIGVLLYDSTGSVAAGLSVSAPIERRRMAWVDDMVAAGREISERLGYRV